MTGTEVFKRTATYDRDSSSIRLHAPQWKLLLAFDGQRTLSELALNAAIPFPEALSMSDSFVKRDWIAEQPITLEEYLKRASASGNFSGGVIPPSVILGEPPSEEKSEPKAENKMEAAVPAAPSLALTPAAIAATATKELPRLASRGTMRLSAVVDFIISIADTIPLGQLLAYRVFLRVPPEILQSEDIVSIHLADDTSLVRSDALQKAISTAVHDIVKRPLPDSVFAPA